MELALDKPDLLASCVQGLTLEEKHLVYLELMIMEQVADWEIGVGRAESQDSGWDKACKLVVNLPNGSTKTIGISQGTQKRYWFGICPISSKIGNLKMCGGCKVVGYVGKEEQVNISYEKIHIFWGEIKVVHFHEFSHIKILNSSFFSGNQSCQQLKVRNHNIFTSFSAKKSTIFSGNQS